MQPVWLIEANVDGLPSEALQAEIRRQGMLVHVVKPFVQAKPPKDILGAEAIPMDACVVFTGTLTLMRHLQQKRRWIPGGWCHFENLACSTYYAYFGQYLLNRNYKILPIAEAIRARERLTASLSREGKLFVRPDAVDKSFAGKLVSADALDTFLVPKSFDPTLLVLVAEPQPIGREWRLFVANGQVITGSQYRNGGTTDVTAGIPAEVLGFANGVLQDVRWRPDPFFVMDVCESNSGLAIVELNSFSCSGHCACDLAQYVAVASRTAASQW